MSANAPSYSDSPRNVTNYLGQNYRFTPSYIRNRNPVSGTSQTLLGDIKPKENQGRYPIGSIWINTAGPEIWILAEINSTGAHWVLIANSLLDGPLLTLSDTLGTIVDPTDSVASPPGNIQIIGGSGIDVTSGTNSLTITNTGSSQSFSPDTGTDPVTGAIVNFSNTTILATGTLANAIRSNGTAADTISYQTQYAGSNAGSSTPSNWGVAQFDSNQFTVASGFVQLAGGGGAPTLGISPDTFTGPGTDPVIPDGSGNITLQGGATFATNTQANPIRTNSLAANTVDIQIQLAGSTAAASAPNKFGVAQFDANAFTVSSGFVTLNNAGTTGAITKILGDDGGANTVVPSSGIVTLTGITVVNATNAKPVYCKKNAASIEEIDVQLTTTSASGAKSINKSGLAHFDSTTFNVDAATGFVSLISSSTLGLTPDTFTGPGTSPVVPNGSGNIVLEGGSTYATGTSANPIRTNSLAANTIDFQIQLAGSNAAVLSATKFGVAQFDSNQFDVTAGFVQLKGGGTSPALTSMILDVATTPINPTAAGAVTLTCGQVATGTVGANVMRTRGNTANSATIEIQRSTTSGASNSTLNGVCHFSSTSFGVDANGFVTFTGSTSPMTWSDQGGNFAASVQNGYFTTAAIVGTLPASPAQGSQIDFVVTSASVLTITANTGQRIRLGNTVSAAAGTAVNTAIGASITLVYRSSDAIWYAIASTGNWTIT